MVQNFSSSLLQKCNKLEYFSLPNLKFTRLVTATNTLAYFVDAAMATKKVFYKVPQNVYIPTKV